MFQELHPSKTYRLLESGPVVLVATGTPERPNVMTMGFHMVLQHSPALVACVIGPWDHSYRALRDSGNCVIALPTVELAETVTKIGNCSGSDIDKFAAFGLTARPARTVTAPLVGECLANLECRIADMSLVKRYSMFVLEVTHIHLNTEKAERRLIHHAGDGRFIVDGATVDMGEHMTQWRHLMD